MSIESWEKWKAKYPEKVLNYNRNYYKNNRERCLLRDREFYKKNKERIKKENNIRFHSLPPWEKTLKGIQGRCNVKSSTAYKRYGGRGIKCLLSKEEIKEIWFRDKAYELKNPSIDRINSDGNYEYSNCRFIEKVENTRRSSMAKMGWSRHHTHCILCGKNDTKHNSYGRCSRCYNRLWRSQNHKRNEKNINPVY